jgi:hypothetical protein
MFLHQLKIPMPTIAEGRASAPNNEMPTEGWKSLRVRKTLWETLIMLQAAKVMTGQSRPSMNDLIVEMATIAAPIMLHTEAEVVGNG